MFANKVLTLSTAAALMAGTALAETTAMATTDLNLRAGPGPNYEIIDVIAGKDNAMVEGCLDDANWCKVSYNGTTGWAYGEYLEVDHDGQVVALYPNMERVEVKTVEFDAGSEAAAAATLGTIGAIAGSLIGGPAAIAAGAIIGGAVGADGAPDEKVITYVVQNPVAPVFLDGEVVVGARLPEGVTVYEVPESDFSYLNVNGQLVLVEPGERKIVYINRS